MLNRLFSILVLSLVAGSAHADFCGTTVSDAAIKNMNMKGTEKFEYACTDKTNSLTWSKALPDTYSKAV